MINDGHRVEAREPLDVPVSQGGDPVTAELSSQTGALLDTRV